LRTPRDDTSSSDRINIREEGGLFISPIPSSRYIFKVARTLATKKEKKEKERKKKKKPHKSRTICTAE